MNRDLGGVYSLHAAESYTFGLVFVLISRLPEGLGGAISKAADHGGATGRLDVNYTGQVL